VIVAVTAMSDGPDARVDPRFGRAAWFVIYDTDTQAWSSVSNSGGASAAQGAGVQAAQAVARAGATVLLTGHCGPKAFRALDAAGVAVRTGASGTVREAVYAYLEGRLPRATGADVEGHW